MSVLRTGTDLLDPAAGAPDPAAGASTSDGAPAKVEPAPAGPATKLRVADLHLTFAGDGKTTPVLAGIDLAVAAGELVCLVGASGCGKTTLLNVIGGFVRADRGEVLIDGRPVKGPDPRRIFVFQERGVFPWLTVTGNIGFGLAGLPAAERGARVSQLVRLVGLEGFEEAYPHELSGGMKQRVEVARALAVDPDMLFLDEPFGALDSITRLTLRRELLRIWQAGTPKTILFVTHDIEEAVQLADRVVVLSQRPAHVQRIVTIDIPHPRDLSSRRYLELRDSIFAEIGLSHRV
jgi:ABC-type nitrate/sulfonate/bicarbonate transport system ATPase subunit